MNPDIVKKILQYAPEPPLKLWEGISKVLDENMPGDLAGKLQNFQVVPPAGTWNKIEEQLANSNQAVVRKGKFFTFARMASAAAIILVATASIIFWNRNPETTMATSAKDPVNVIPENPPSHSSSPSPADIEKTTKTENNQDLIAVSNRSRVQTNNNSTSNRNTNKQSFASYQPSAAVVHSFIPYQAEEKAIAVSSYPIDKYMVYSDDDGNAMRLSKKLFDLISCVKEELICQQQVEQMQYKIASYMTTNDFTGLMDMLRNMKENK